LVITQDRLLDRAKRTRTQRGAFRVNNFMMTPVYDEVVTLLKQQRQ
jgi:mannitol-specific phosphotransferase system IIBC component